MTWPQGIKYLGSTPAPSPLTGRFRPSLGRRADQQETENDDRQVTVSKHDHFSRFSSQHNRAAWGRHTRRLPHRVSASHLRRSFLARNY